MIWRTLPDLMWSWRLSLAPHFSLALLLALAFLVAPRPARAEVVTVPLDIGIGPAGHWLTGIVGDDQAVHTGLRLSLVAIADHDLIMKNIKRVPAQYRQLATQMREYRHRPSIFIPATIIISPKVRHTGMYGATWRLLPISLDLAPDRTTRLELNVSPLLTYTFVHSDTLPNGTMHFLRPGVDIGFEWTIPVLEDAFLVSLGYASQFYVPQAVGGSLFELPDGRPSIWHIAQLFLVLHWRVPYDVHL